ncbi:MAG: Eco57I restriction-modification methylase domain-containing protein [Actinomycetota bacterium]
MIDAGSARPVVQPKGVVYTRGWVVDLILDLVGYRIDRDLASLHAVEPSAGEGAFLVAMVKRLMTSLRAHGRPLEDASEAITAFELDAGAGERVVENVTGVLVERGVNVETASRLARGWVRVGDYLLDAPEAPKADVVVGNPPYIRYDDVPPDVLARYRAAYTTMVGRGDIYIGFMEAAIRSLKPDGVVSFICADRWMRSAYGVELRRLIAASCSVDVVIEMHNAPAFEDDVSAYPAVVVIRRASQGDVLMASAGATAGEVPVGSSLADALVASADGGMPPRGITATRMKGWFKGAAPWPTATPRKLDLLQHLESGFTPLEDPMTGTRIGIGIATGADRIYVTTNEALVESDRLLPLAMAADTRTGAIVWSGHFLVNPWTASGDLVDLNSFPRLRSYFQEHRAEIERRTISRRHREGWYRTIDKVNGALLPRPKLYFPDMKMTSNPVLDRGVTYPHHNLYFLTSEHWDLEVLGGLLLSNIAQLFIEAYCVRMRGGTLRFQAQYLRRIHVPAPESIRDDVAERLRVAFAERDAAAATAAAIDAYEIPEFAGEFGC